MTFTIKIYKDEELNKTITTDRAVVVSDNTSGILINKSDIADMILLAAKIRAISNKIIDLIIEKNLLPRELLEDMVTSTIPEFSDELCGSILN